MHDCYYTPVVQSEDVNIALNEYPYTNGWGKLHRKEQYILHLSAGIIAIIRSIMRAARPVARTGKLSSAYKVSVLKLKGEIFLKNGFITQTVYTKCTKTSYKIVPATNFTT